MSKRKAALSAKRKLGESSDSALSVSDEDEQAKDEVDILPQVELSDYEKARDDRVRANKTELERLGLCGMKKANMNKSEKNIQQANVNSSEKNIQERSSSSSSNGVDDDRDLLFRQLIGNDHVQLLDARRLQSVISDLRIDLDLADVRDMIDYFDSDCKGALSKEDFARILSVL